MSRNAQAVWALSLLLCGMARGQPAEIRLEDPKQDFAFLEFEPYPEFKSRSSLNENQSRYWRAAGQVSFPAGHAYGHFLFGSFKGTLINRDIVYHDTLLNGGPLRRYWLSGGMLLLDNPRQTSALIAAVGLNSDFADLGRKDWNGEWAYTHTFQATSRLRWGLGLDVQYYFGKFVPYPLGFLDWRLSDKTKLVWDADFVELRRFVAPKLAFTLGTRFNLEFFALKRDGSYEYQSGGAEAGVQYSLGKHSYVRFKYKELFWGRETLGLPDGSLHTTEIHAGRSLRLNFAYGI